MELLPRKPDPHLLDSAESVPPFDSGEVAVAQRVVCRSHRRWRSIVGVALVLLVAGVGWLYQSSPTAPSELRKLVEVATHSLSTSYHSGSTLPATTPPAPIVVQLSTDVVQVTAIALGHPRLAVINGKSVAEGDTFVVHTPVRSVALTLRVLTISDGMVQFWDGSQVVAARLTLPSPPPGPAH